MGERYQAVGFEEQDANCIEGSAERQLEQPGNVLLKRERERRVRMRRLVPRQRGSPSPGAYHVDDDDRWTKADRQVKDYLEYLVPVKNMVSLLPA